MNIGPITMAGVHFINLQLKILPYLILLELPLLQTSHKLFVGGNFPRDYEATWSGDELLDEMAVDNFPVDTTEGQDTGLVSDQITGVAGQSIELNCDLTPTIKGDELLLVLWYKIGVASPVYTFDVRSRSLGSARHYSDVTLFDEPTRAVFRAIPIPSALIISNLIQSDEGVYKCRADFKKSPTKHFLHNLTVIVPPHPPSIYDEQGRKVSEFVGPIKLGENLLATCVSNGGKPEPSLSWWEGDTLLENSFQVLNGQTINTVTLENITYSYQHRKLTCRASNNELVPSVSTDVIVKVAYPPSSVELDQLTAKLFSGEEAFFSCSAYNTSGNITFRWFMGKKELFDHSQTEEGELWKSALRYIPSYSDHHNYLSCRATNQHFPETPLEDGKILQILFTPQTGIEFGRNLSPDSVKEGDDVYFVCLVESNPPHYAVKWRHNGKYMNENVGQGIIFGNQTLVLQKVKSEQGGLYTCTASNQVGDGESNAISLDIKYVPKCRKSEPSIVVVNLRSEVEIGCQVESNPPATTYQWKFKPANSTSNQRVELRTSDRKLVHSTYTDEGYGTLSCWATNSMGPQSLEEPCSYIIIKPDRPGKVENCQTTNTSHHSVIVSCSYPLQDASIVTSFEDSESYVKQKVTFVAKIQIGQHQEIARLQNEIPEFNFTDLEPDTEYLVEITGHNDKGTSEPVVVRLETTKLAERRLAVSTLEEGGGRANHDQTPSVFNILTVLGVAAGVVLGLLGAVIGLLLAFRRRNSRGGSRSGSSSMAGSEICLEEIRSGGTSSGPAPQPSLPRKGILVNSRRSSSHKSINQDYSECIERLYPLDDKYGASSDKHSDKYSVSSDRHSDKLSYSMGSSHSVSTRNWDDIQMSGSQTGELLLPAHKQEGHTVRFGSLSRSGQGHRKSGHSTSTLPRKTGFAVPPPSQFTDSSCAQLLSRSEQPTSQPLDRCQQLSARAGQLGTPVLDTRSAAVHDTSVQLSTRSTAPDGRSTMGPRTGQLVTTGLETCPQLSSVPEQLASTIVLAGRSSAATSSTTGRKADNAIQPAVNVTRL